MLRAVLKATRIHPPLRRAFATKTASLACSSCGAPFIKWQGQCNRCKEWDTIVDEVVVSSIYSRYPLFLGSLTCFSLVPLLPLSLSLFTITILNNSLSNLPKVPENKHKQQSWVKSSDKPEIVRMQDVTQATHLARIPLDDEEVSRVLGGGLVVGSVMLLSGSPGIGKSTFALQMGSSLGEHHRVLYVSAEESASQVKTRADRLGGPSLKLDIFTEPDLNEVAKQLSKGEEDVSIRLFPTFFFGYL